MSEEDIFGLKVETTPYENLLQSLEVHSENLMNASQWLEHNIYCLSSFSNLNDYDLYDLSKVINKSENPRLKDWFLSRLTEEDQARLKYMSETTLENKVAKQ